MPELPEVEVTRRGLAALAGARVEALALGKPLRWPLGCAPSTLVGTQLGELTRRGKYLLMPLSAAAGDSAGVLLWHLGMSGSLTWWPAAPPPAGPHDHVELRTDRGCVRLGDPRRFGALVWSPSVSTPPASTLLARLGPEPWSAQLDALSFHAALQRRRQPVKLALLSGELVVGAGNIYACEALFEAGIDPRTPCDRIGPVRAARLLAAVRQVLDEAIEAGGSTLRDFRDAHGVSGEYQQARARVYGRQGLPCPRCGAPVRRLVQGQRATYHCVRCQRR